MMSALLYISVYFLAISQSVAVVTWPAGYGERFQGLATGIREIVVEAGSGEMGNISVTCQTDLGELATGVEQNETWAWKSNYSYRY